MKHLLLVVLCIALASCGTTSAIKGEQATNYVIGSCFQAGGVYKLLRGELSGCKATFHGINLKEFLIEKSGTTWTMTVGDDEPDG